MTGKAGVPTATEPATPTPSSDPSLSFDCYRGDKGEECCQRAPKPPLHWCSGDFPRFWCYNAETQYCCTNDVVCDEEGCCEDLFVRVRQTYPLAYPATWPSKFDTE